MRAPSAAHTTDGHADRQSGRLANWQTCRRTVRQTGLLTDRQADSQAGWLTNRHADGQSGRLAYWQTGRRTYWLTDWLTLRQTCRQTVREADRQSGRRTHNGVVLVITQAGDCCLPTGNLFVPDQVCDVDRRCCQGHQHGAQCDQHTHTQLDKNMKTTRHWRSYTTT